MIAALARSTLVRVLLTVGILGYLFTRFDPADAGRAILGVRPLNLLAVLGLVALDRATMVARWYVLLRASETAVTLKSAAWIFLVSSFVGSFLPAGVGGDAARAYALSRRTVRGSEAVASVAVDRLAGMLSIVLLGLVGLLAWNGRLDPAVRSSATWLAGLAGVGITAALWADRLLRAVLPNALLASSVGSRALRTADAVARYRVRPGALTTVMALSFAVQFLRIVQAYVLGLGLGISIPLTYYLVFMPVGLLMLLLPVSVSGFGLPQGVIVWLLRPMGVPDAQSFALSTLIVLTGLAGNLPGAWLYVRRQKT